MSKTSCVYQNVNVFLFFKVYSVITESRISKAIKGTLRSDPVQKRVLRGVYDKNEK